MTMMVKLRGGSCSNVTPSGLIPTKVTSLLPRSAEAAVDPACWTFPLGS